MKEVVKFESKWCGPCKAIAPVLEKLKSKYKDIKFNKVDVESDTETTAQFKVRSVPTIVFLNGGQLVNQIVGNIADEVLNDAVANLNKMEDL